MSLIIKAQSTGNYSESEGQVRAENLVNALRCTGVESIHTMNEETTGIEPQDTRAVHEPHNRVSGRLIHC